jgi:pimeloyl-ACP methyl ester carboxylesterase
LRLFFPTNRMPRLPSLPIRCLLTGTAAPKSLVRAVQCNVASARPEVLLSRLELISQCDVRAQLAQVSVPVLYLQAAGDRVVPARCLDEILAIRPNTLAARIEGPHLLLQSEPQNSARAIFDFIQQLDRCESSRAI